MDEMADSSDPATLETSTHSAVEPPDAELVRLAANADEAAFEQLFLRHRRRVALIAGRFFAAANKSKRSFKRALLKPTSLSVISSINRKLHLQRGWRASLSMPVQTSCRGA